MTIEHEPKDELSILSNQIQSAIRALGFDIFIPDEDEMHAIYADKAMEPNQTLIAVESNKKLTGAKIKQIAEVIAKLDSPLYEVTERMIEGGNIGYIIIKPKIN